MDQNTKELVEKVIAYYPLTVKQISQLSYKTKKPVFLIQTANQEFVMKKVPYNEERIVFMAHAIDYLRAAGIHTPVVIRTSDGKVFVKWGDDYYVLFEAVYGRKLSYGDRHDLNLIMKGMASFHKASKGIESPTGVFPLFLLTRWTTDLRTRYGHLIEWKREKSQAPELNEFDNVFLAHVDTFLKQSETTFEMLAQSSYEQWAEETKSVKMLCHQDYATGNLALGDEGQLYVYDMDSLAVDLPIRDLRKILNKVMKEEGMRWDLPLMIRMLKSYQEVNPLTKEQYGVLAAEIQYPHLFYGQVSKYYQQRYDETWTFEKQVARLKEIVKIEEGKQEVLRAFMTKVDEVVQHGS